MQKFSARIRSQRTQWETPVFVGLSDPSHWSFVDY